MSNVVNINKYSFKEKYIRAKDMADIFIGVSPSTVEKWAKKGLLPSYKIDGSRFYCVSEVEELIRNSKEVV